MAALAFRKYCNPIISILGVSGFVFLIALSVYYVILCSLLQIPEQDFQYAFKLLFLISVMGLMGLIPALIFKRFWSISLGLDLSLIALALVLALNLKDSIKDVNAEGLKHWIPLNSQFFHIQWTVQMVERWSGCCGLLSGPLDWGLNGTAAPGTCICIDAGRGCSMVHGQMLYSTPCQQDLLPWINELKLELGPVVLSVVCLGLFLLPLLGWKSYMETPKKEGGGGENVPQLFCCEKAPNDVVEINVKM